VSSVYDDISRRLARDPRLTKRGGARFDMSLMLFNQRECIHELWMAADEHLACGGGGDDKNRLREAVEKLRFVFGDVRRP